jgi:hypothetical protein
MRRIPAFGVWACSLALCIGCGGRNDDGRTDERDDDDLEIAETSTIVETGCLTATGDRFVLTALEGGGRAETEMYQLVGSVENLRPHVGREVQVTGVAEPAQVADIRERSASATPTGTSGTQTKDGTQPQVQTEAQTRLETRRMRVSSVTATGDDCAGAIR